MGHAVSKSVYISSKSNTIKTYTRSSGIGLATIRMSAKRGAKVVVTTRNLTALKELVNEL